MIRAFYRKFVPECLRKAVRSCLSKISSWQIVIDDFFVIPTICRIPVWESSSQVKVGFFVVYESNFQMESVFVAMLDDPIFQPEIVIIPDTARGDSHMAATYQTTFDFLRAKYGDKVVDVRNRDGTFKDVARNYDICALMNPYFGMTLEQFTISGVARRHVPVVFSRYFHDNGTVWSPLFNASLELKWISRFYVENQNLADELGKAQPVLRRGGKIVVVGCPKIDALSKIARRSSSRKRILIAPHHTITKAGGVFAISNFLRLKDFVLTLPKKYPDVDWVFRPHPLLMVRMVNEGFWTEDEKMAWVAKLNSYSNMTYENGGSYLDSFANSDALIQDCGSFLPEYFYTGHPQCYVLRDEAAINEQFVDWGKELLSHTYKAYSEQNIIDFIENVVIAGNDPMKDEREKFAKEKLMFNYPHASEAIVADIKKALGRT